MRSINYPFVPKSTAYLKPGQFWSIPLNNGLFACGRVLQLEYKNDKRDTRVFLASLMDWVNDLPPSFASIEGTQVVEQGKVHVKTIRENNGEILGHRPLELDNIEPGLFVSARGGYNVKLLRGVEVLRDATREEYQTLPVLSMWGYKVIKILAEKHFGASIQT
jgi:hypothetical protein